MRINNTGIEFQRSEQAKGVDGANSGSGKRSVAQPPAAVQRGDSVQISDAGRALASQQAEGAGGPRGELTPERISAIREKILQGAYNSVEVVDEVARRMLERGDI